MEPISGPAKLGEILAGGKPLLPTSVRMYAQGMMGRNRPVTERDFTQGELDVIRGLAEASQYHPPPVENPEPSQPMIIEIDGGELVDVSGSGPPRTPDGVVTYNDYWLPDQEIASGDETSVLGPWLSKIASPYVGEWYEDAISPDALGSVQSTLGQFSATPTVEGYRIQDTYDFHDEWDNNGPPVWEQVKDFAANPGGQDLMALLETIAVRHGPSEREGTGIPVDFTVPYREGDPQKRRIIQALLNN